MSKSEFTYPWEYGFPPFFTIQPNLDTRKHQLEAWRTLILDYCKHHKVTHIRLVDWLGKPPFSNDSINRRLSLDAMKTIINHLVKEKYGNWLEKKTDCCVIYGRSKQGWADIIYQYVQDNGLQNTVLTLYELLHGDATKNQYFHGLEPTIFVEAMQVLEDSKKAALIRKDGECEGVKFF